MESWNFIKIDYQLIGLIARHKYHLKETHYELISGGIAISKLQINQVLIDYLKNNHELYDKVKSIDARHLGEEDRSRLEAINTEVIEYIGPQQPNLQDAWANIHNSFLDSIACGWELDENVMAALILAGAAISRPDISLRRDLDQSLYNARDDYLKKCENNNIDPITGKILGSSLRTSIFYLAIITITTIFSSSLFYIGAEKIVNQGEFTSWLSFIANGFIGFALIAFILFQTKAKPILAPIQFLRGKSLGSVRLPTSTPYDSIVESYQKLKIPPNGVLAGKIKELLEDDSKTLRVGASLNKLKISSLVSAKEKNFFEEKTRTPSIRPIEGNDYLKKRGMFGPVKILLHAIKFDCIKRQEISDDEIFWIGFTSQIANLKDVYDQIDNAFTTRGSLRGLELKVEWSTNYWRSRTIQDVNEGNDGVPIVPQSFGSINVYNGFAPWNSIIYCIEDDDEEYKAISEVFDNIGDYADDVADVADKVALVSGNTAVSVAAEATAMVARCVEILASVGAGIVRICNFFDDNDTIGIIHISPEGGGDYVNVKPGIEDYNKNTQSRIEDAVYKLYYRLTFVESVSFERMWRYQQVTKCGKEREGADIMCMGNSGDVVVKIDLGERYESIIGKGVYAYDSESRDCRNRSGCHAEWVAGPVFSPDSDNTKVMGVVHWGVENCENVNYKPWVTVIKIKCEA